MKEKIWIISDEEGLWVTKNRRLMEAALGSKRSYYVLELLVDEGQQPIVNLIDNEELMWRF